MYDTGNKANFEDGEERLTPTKKLNNVINRQTSVAAGQCPFSGGV